MLKQATVAVFILLMTTLCRADDGREPPIIVDVHSTHTKVAPTTFAVLPLSYQESSSLFEKLAGIIAERLKEKGYTETGPAQAKVLVMLAYTIYTDDSDVYAPPVYTRVLRLTLLDRAAYQQKQLVKLYEASTVSRGLYSNLEMLLPLHLNAIFYDFPGPSSAQKAYKVSGMGNDQVTPSHSTAVDPLFQYMSPGGKFSFTIE